MPGDDRERVRIHQHRYVRAEHRPHDAGSGLIRTEAGSDDPGLHASGREHCRPVAMTDRRGDDIREALPDQLNGVAGTGKAQVTRPAPTRSPVHSTAAPGMNRCRR